MTLAKAVEHTSCDSQAAFFSGYSRQPRSDCSSDGESHPSHNVLGQNFERGVALVQHPAASALARDSDKSIAVRARRIDFVVDDRVGSVADPQAHQPEPLRHFGFFFVTTGAGAEALVKRTGGFECRAAKGHVCAEHTWHLDDFLATIENWEIQVNPVLADPGGRILCRQNSSSHRRELRMGGEKLHDCLKIGRSRCQVIIEQDNYIALRFSYGTILNAALPAPWIVKMLKRRQIRRELHWFWRTVFRNEQLVAPAQLPGETREEASERLRSVVSRDDDREGHEAWGDAFGAG